MQALQQEGVQRAEGTSQLQDWNMEHKDLEARRKTENLKTEMQKNKVSVLGVSEVRWTGQGEIRKIRSGDYTVYYSGGEWAERGAATVVHKSIVRRLLVMTESLLLS